MGLPTNIQGKLSQTTTMIKPSSQSRIYGAKFQILQNTHVDISYMKERFKIKKCIISAC